MSAGCRRRWERRRFEPRGTCVVARCAPAVLLVGVGGCLVAICEVTPAKAQVPTASREELMRQWDVNRDGKIDAGEAEMAHSQMRRKRADAIRNSGSDPVTGMPRAAADPVTGQPGRPQTDARSRGLSSADDDGGLILVPGNGEQPRTSPGAAADSDLSTRPSKRERANLPGTRAPTVGPSIPSVSPRVPTGLPGGEPPSRSPLERPGIISGGTRSGASGARPGTGMTAPAGRTDASPLNAGRLPGGLPQSRGSVPGMAAGPRLGPMQQPGAGRLAGPMPTTPTVPTAPRPGVGPSRGTTVPAMPSARIPSAPVPGMRQPEGARSPPRPPSTVPRVPRMTTDEFYGR